MANKALIAAIDHYPNPRNNLPSCLADAAAFERTLRGAFGFTETPMLLDHMATLSNVRSGLNWLFSGAGPNDRLVFYFSGHGYQARNGQDLDEVLCLYDQFLFDNELSERTRSLPPGVFTMISDSCHSGGLYKVMFGDEMEDLSHLAQTKVLRVPPLEQEDKAFVHPVDVRSLRYRPFGALPRSPAALSKRFGLPMPKGYDEGGQLAMNGLLLSACLEDETASASTPKTNGLSAFTYALLQQLGTLGPRVSNQRLMEATTATLKQLGFRQTPVLMEPTAPPGIAGRSFLLLEEMVASEPKSFGIPNQDEIRRVIQQSIEALRRGSMPAAATA
ncbi:caspase family protein [Muricoccus aerilatus]|uniref:caspase family protein n=1 Tax=Muricoccus aerilatus TaxID=452982 RepID=UPI0005C1D0B1|nr:caspase family protein [Roseomonas aerilata]